MLRAHYDTKIILNNDYLSIVGSVVSRGLCSFYAKEYKAYAGMNPKTGETTQVKPKKLPFFKCGKELTERVDN
ncbi:MAG: HU family DNA-binding protein [Deltaproteobacteria bacterium]|nr:HU family DNA-binding protein [Deltaproteobacteria bacterium]